MTLKITVTDAGRAAIRNAQANGTNAVLLAMVGVTATAFNQESVTGAIPDEIKRIATISGGTTAPDTIHVTVSDNSADSYAVRGIGLYLQDGTLLGAFSQADPLLEKSAQATMLLAVDVQFGDIDATTITFGDTNFQLNLATTDRVGIVELATDTESINGTDPQRPITPKGLKATLDDRLGANAPSSLVKTLLTKSSVLAFVTALGIRNAAQFDTGAGNGLDADLLDGQQGSYYRSWANLTGVPISFPPSGHQHSAADITGGTLAVARGGTGTGWISAGSYVVGNGTNAVQSRTPVQVLADIGAAPVFHTHTISAVSGLQAVLDSKAPNDSPAFTGPVTANFTMDVVGTLHAGGAISTGDRFEAGGNIAVLSPAISGEIHLRPQAHPSGTGQVTITDSSVVVPFDHHVGRNLFVNGYVQAAGGLQGSDRRLKKNIRRRPVLRGLALALAKQFKQWDRKADGKHDVGLIAQGVEKLAPWYVHRGQDKRRMRAIDKSGIALECAFDNALHLAEIDQVFAALDRRIKKLESAA